MDYVSWSDSVMQEEIFGPIMPILTYSNLDSIIDKINSMSKSFGFIYFTKNKQVF